MPQDNGEGLLFNPISRDRLKLYSPLALAYIGDAVFELMARRHEAGRGINMSMNRLHASVVAHVRAPAQARAAAALEALLTSEEAEIFRKGRNANVAGVPKGATPAEYSTATALEALFGYLYLAGEYDRLDRLFEVCMGE